MRGFKCYCPIPVHTKGQNGTLGPTGCFLTISQVLLSYFITDYPTEKQLIFLNSVSKMEHFDEYYNPVGHKKFWVHFWLLLFLASKLNIKWVENFCLNLPLRSICSKLSLIHAKSPQLSGIPPFSPFFSLQGDM